MKKFLNRISILLSSATLLFLALVSVCIAQTGDEKEVKRQRTYARYIIRINGQKVDWRKKYKPIRQRKVLLQNSKFLCVPESVQKSKARAQQAKKFFIPEDYPHYFSYLTISRIRSHVQGMIDAEQLDTQDRVIVEWTRQVGMHIKNLWKFRPVIEEYEEFKLNKAAHALCDLKADGWESSCDSDASQDEGASGFLTF